MNEIVTLVYPSNKLIMKRGIIIGLTLATLLGIGWVFNLQPKATQKLPEILITNKTKGRSIQGLTRNRNPVPTDDSLVREIIARLGKNGPPVLTAEQIQGYLISNDRDAMSLIVGSRLSKNPELLREAVQRFADNPLVQLEMTLHGTTPAERQDALAAFKIHDPQNPLCEYLDTALSFEKGDYAQATDGLLQSLDRGTLQDYSLVLSAGTEAAYLAGGYSPAESQIYALYDSAQRNKDTTEKLSGVADTLGNLRDQFIKNNDIDGAEPTVAVGLDIGQKIQAQDKPSFLSRLVGLEIEIKILGQLDPLTPVGPDGQSAVMRLDELNQQKNALQGLLQKTQDFPMDKMSDEQMKDYVQHVRNFGEIEAAQWWSNQNQ